MKTEIFKIDDSEIDLEIMQYCARRVRAGALVCFPTETVYGLGANAFNAAAVRNIFKAKGRPADNPLIVHISGMDMLDLVTDCFSVQRELLLALGKIYWPGPLTMIASRDSAIPAEVSCGLPSVGIRFPKNRIAQKLIELSGVPIAAPSANLSGKPSPTCAEHVLEDMNGRVDIILDGGACAVGVESTVLDLTGAPPSILRPGAVTLESLHEIISDVTEYNWKEGETPNMGEIPRSPGMKYTHYAPKAEVTIYKGEPEKVAERINDETAHFIENGILTGVLATEQTLHFYQEVSVVLSLGDLNDGMEQASRLFACLREFDERGVQKIFAEAVPCGGVGDAVMNRMFRAAGGRIIDVF